MKNLSQELYEIAKTYKISFHEVTILAKRFDQESSSVPDLVAKIKNSIKMTKQIKCELLKNSYEIAAIWTSYNAHLLQRQRFVGKVDLHRSGYDMHNTKGMIEANNKALKTTREMINILEDVK